jgi:hypothetical protein
MANDDFREEILKPHRRTEALQSFDPNIGLNF